MVGMRDEDLKPAMRIDVEGVYRAKTSSVSATATGIIGACQTGRKSWCRRSFAVTRDRNRDILLCRKPIEHASRPTYAEDSYFFDAIIPQPPIVE